jgi:hypothetical protein
MAIHVATAPMVRSGIGPKKVLRARQRRHVDPHQLVTQPDLSIGGRSGRISLGPRDRAGTPPPRQPLDYM